MDVREKLVDVFTHLGKHIRNGYEYGIYYTSDFTEAVEEVLKMLKNSVTVQEWISVEDRLPEESGLYITFGCTAVPLRRLHNFDKDIGKFGAWWNYEPPHRGSKAGETKIQITHLCCLSCQRRAARAEASNG